MKLWSKSFGERGRKVRIYERRPGGMLERSVFIGNKEVRKSLGHRDRDLAEQQAYQLLAQLKVEVETVGEDTVTLGTLMKEYTESPAWKGKKKRTRDEDERKLRRVVGFFGAGRITDTLDESDSDNFIDARRRGDVGLIGVTPARKVRDRAIESDLVALHTMLNWATKARNERGKHWLVKNPLHGAPIPHEMNPVRPVTIHETYEKLLIVASDVNAMLPYFMILIEGTGRRLSACRQLLCSDVDLKAETVHWRKEYDKKGRDAVRPIDEAVVTALKTWQKESARIDSQWLFPSPQDPMRPVSRHLLDSWLRKAYALAGLTPQRGGMWHPFRRKFATERKDMTVKNVADYAGWKPETLLNIYQQPDVESMREVAKAPTRRLVEVL